MSSEPPQNFYSKYPYVIAIAYQAPKGGLFYAPGKKNIFAGLKYERVIFDTGCASLLLPFPNLKAEEFWQLFKKDVWKISQSSSIGALSSPVLAISKIGGYEVSLAGAQNCLSLGINCQLKIVRAF